MATLKIAIAQINCTVGDIYMDTDAASGQRIYACQTTDNWALQGDGSGGASGWTDANPNVYVTDSTDKVAIGTTTIGTARVLVEQTAAACGELLAKAGWIPYSDAVEPRYYKRNAIRLTVYVATGLDGAGGIELISQNFNVFGVLPTSSVVIR